MKRIFFYLTILSLHFLAAISSNAQNLVSNCSFEQYDTCPDNEGQIQRSIGWFKTYGDADYYNSCSSGAWSVPPQINYQLAASGNAFAGVIFYNKIVGSVEVIHTQLSSPLATGTTYYVSFKVNLCLNNAAFMNVAINKIGAKFTTGPPPFPNNSAHVFTNTVITDTVNWTTISGSFVADSAYTHLYLGVFFDTSNVTSPIMSPTLIDRAYYFVDDVVVSGNPSEICNLVGIQEALGENDFVLFPNPVIDICTIHGVRSTISKIEIHNLFGEKVTGTTVLPFSFWRRDLRDEATINVSFLPPGIYFITITDENKNRITRKFIKL